MQYNVVHTQGLDDIPPDTNLKRLGGGRNERYWSMVYLSAVSRPSYTLVTAWQCTPVSCILGIVHLTRFLINKHDETLLTLKFHRSAMQL